jgi:hypothetical protein
VNVKNGTSTDEVIEEKTRIIQKKVIVTNFVHKKWNVFCSKIEIIAKLVIVLCGTVTKIVEYRYILHNFASSFALKFVTTIIEYHMVL